MDMIKNKSVDADFRRMEENVLTEVPEMVWSGVSSTLNKRKKNKAVWFFVWAGLWTIMSYAILYMTLSTPEATTITSKDVAPTVQVSSSSKQAIETNESHPLLTTVESNSNHVNAAKKAEIKTSISSPKGLISRQIIKEIPISNNGSILSIQPLNQITLFNHTPLLPTSISSTMSISFRDEGPCPPWTDNKSHKYFVEFGGLVGSHRKQYQSNSELSMARDGTEKEWYTWGSYLGVGVSIRPQLYVKLSANFMQQKETFVYTNNTATRLVVDMDPATGNPMRSYTQSGKYISEGEARYNTLDGALHFGFVVKPSTQTKSWQLALEPGLLYNMTLSTRGKYLDSSSQVSRLEENEVYKSNLGLGIQSQLAATKQLNCHIALQIKPYHKMYFNSWNSGSNSIDVQVHSFGIQLGLINRF